MVKFTFEQIKEKLNIINPNIDVLSESVKETGKTKKRIRRFVHCKCKIDGYEWDGETNQLLGGAGCIRCAHKMLADKSRLTLEEIKEKLRLINKNIEILSDEYINARLELKCKCLIDNYEWENSWGHLSKGQGCPQCSNHIQLTLEEIKKRLNVINPSIEIISTNYLNANEKLKLKCKIDEYQWEATWGSLSVGSGCNICAIKNNSGENCYNYNPGLTTEERVLGRKVLGEKIHLWRKQVYERDNYACNCCGNRSSIGNTVILNAHHLDGYHWCKEKRVDVDNGVTLCNHCHKEFHFIYLRKNNTRQQYEEFKQLKTQQVALTM